MTSPKAPYDNHTAAGFPVVIGLLAISTLVIAVIVKEFT